MTRRLEIPPAIPAADARPTPTVGVLPAAGSHPPAAGGTPVFITPAYGVRSTGTFGIRGYRAHCEACGYLGNVVSYSGARSQQTAHVCRPA